MKFFRAKQDVSNAVAAVFLMMLPQAAKAAASSSASAPPAIQAAVASLAPASASRRAEWIAAVGDRVTVVAGSALECVYNLDADKIEVSEAAGQAGGEALARCLAPAVAQMKYEEIEERWLSHLGLKQAWVVRQGVPQVVEPGLGGLAEPTARATWVVLATREMTAELGGGSGDRAIASTSTHSDPLVRELLGM